MATLLSTPEARPRRERAPHLKVIRSEAAEPARRALRHIVVIEPTSFRSHEHAAVFRATSYATHIARAWVHAVEWVERKEIDAVLLDLDLLDASVSQLNVSSARLITLLRRVPRSSPLIVAAVSYRDFFEIEDALRAGVNVFVSRQAPLLTVLQRIEAACLRHSRESERASA
jgi:DNA-binding NarL/FixJ family response regulator